MVARNDITGDAISTKYNSTQYTNNFDLIFGKKNVTESNSTDAGIIISEEPSIGCGVES